MRVRHQSWPQQRTCKRARFQNAATAPSAETLDSSLDGLKKELLAAVEGLERGTKNEQMPDKTAKVLRILRDIDARKCCPKISSESLSADWRLLWTTEKETLFILQRAGVFGTKAGNVWQVIDAKEQTLNNIIEFPPSGQFAVAASIQPSTSGNYNTVNFKFESAKLVTPRWTIPVPPFGQGWFQTVYIDDEIRIAKDSRKDWLIIERSRRNQ